jgi:sensor histidine kinase YesM
MGVGLNNVKERLRNYYGTKAALEVSINPEKGTMAEAKFPVKVERAETRP